MDLLHKESPGARPKDGCGDCGDMVPPLGGIESARLLGNEARDRLLAAGLDEELIVRLADDFIAERRGRDLDAFISWALHCAGRAGPVQ
jgi:hypothetical protein